MGYTKRQVSPVLSYLSRHGFIHRVSFGLYKFVTDKNEDYQLQGYHK